jgi:hypothetical protein
MPSAERIPIKSTRSKTHWLSWIVPFPGTDRLPTDERSAAALFALAATSPEPIPVIAQMDVLRLRRGLRLQTQSQGPSMAATNRPNAARWAEAGGWRGGCVRQPGDGPSARPATHKGSAKQTIDFG